MTTRTTTGIASLLLGTALMACSSEITQPEAVASLDLVTEEIEVMIPALDFDEANVSKAIGICVMDTPSGTLVLKEANPNTPSQPCPPPFFFKGKTEAVKIRKEWLIEDENRNGAVCVKEASAGKFIVKDDNAATPSQPCPPAFLLVGKERIEKPEVPAKILAQADDNDNGSVCLRVMESGNFIVRDDDANLPSQPCPPAYSHEVVGKKVACDPSLGLECKPVEEEVVIKAED
jgi:hypothetical protein